MKRATSYRKHLVACMRLKSPGAIARRARRVKSFAGYSKVNRRVRRTRRGSKRRG